MEKKIEATAWFTTNPPTNPPSFRGSLSGPQAVGSLVGLPGGRESTGLVNCRNIKAVSVAHESKRKGAWGNESKLRGTNKIPSRLNV